MEEYFSNYERLSERFLEQEEYIHSLDGTHVEWEGYVSNVSGSEGEVVRLTIGDTRNEVSPNNVIVTFPASFKTKLFSLQKGDHVRFLGTLDLSRRPDCPAFDGDSIEVLVE